MEEGTKLCTVIQNGKEWIVENIIVIDIDADEADYGGRPFVEGDRIGNMVSMAHADIDAEVSEVNMLIRVYEKQVAIGQIPFITESEKDSLIEYREIWKGLRTHESFPRIVRSALPDLPVAIDRTKFVNAFLSI
jgi:hypothetical protein